MSDRFDELVNGERLDPEERRRLERAHELLLAAGEPAELTPALATPPVPRTPAPAELPTASPRRDRMRLRRVGLAAAAAVAAACLLIGYVIGDRVDDSFDTERVVALAGGGAEGELRIGVPDEAGNRILEFSVEGLAPHPERGYYELFLEDEGEPGLPCGGFRVEDDGTITLRFPVPYSIEAEDRWVVTNIVPGEIRWPGDVVMRMSA
jgi:hypothetical protein